VTRQDQVTYLKLFQEIKYTRFDILDKLESSYRRIELKFSAIKVKTLHYKLHFIVTFNSYRIHVGGQLINIPYRDRLYYLANLPKMTCLKISGKLKIEECQAFNKPVTERYSVLKLELKLYFLY